MRYLPNLLLSFSLALVIIVPGPVHAAAENIATYPILPPTYSSIKVFDREGRFTGRLMPENRYWTPIERIPAFLQQALVAVEDARFYEHGGIDAIGIARALVKDIVKGRMAEGGSTITQQLVKNRHLSNEKTLDRKVREGIIAVEYEQKYTKKQILEMYFNEIYYGNGAWGIAQAARLYFDKNPEELTEAECAILAGVPKNPARYNPLGKAGKVNGRRDVVLQRMKKLNMITEGRRKKLRSQRVNFIQQNQAPYYLAQVREKLIAAYGRTLFEQGGLEIIAALDLNLQLQAEQAVRDGARRISPEIQGALFSMDLASGDLLALVGGTDYARSAYNRAIQARRQPGSTIKPLIYAAAIEKGLNPAGVWDDTPVTYRSGDNSSWSPKNYGNETFGRLPLRRALAFSNNIIAVKLLESVGLESFGDFAARAGLQQDLRNGFSLALGTAEVSLQELVQAYTPLANDGVRTEARTIIRVFDRRNNTVTENPSLNGLTTTPATAFITTSMLKDVLAYGTAKNLRRFSLEQQLAGKTGTTDDYRDAWFIGYSPLIITGVWVGHDIPKPGGRSFTGGAAAAPIWERFMRQALASRQPADFRQPATVVSLTVDQTTGYPATSACPSTNLEFFDTAHLPVSACPLHQGQPLNPPPAAQEKMPDLIESR